MRNWWLSQWVIGLVFILVVIFLAISAFGVYSYRRPLPQTEGATYLSGLGDEALIFRDEWGVPHIYASTSYDLFFAQGYVHAQDRWWQMELQRHIGTGNLSSIAGEDETIQATDEFIRVLGWGKSAQTDWETISANAQMVLEAYSAGVNAYLEDRSQSDLAVQYTVLGLTGRGFEVTPWQPQDTLAWIKALNWQLGGDFPEAYAYSHLMADLPPDLAEIYEPYTWNQLIPVASQWQLLNGLDPRQMAFLARPVPPRAVAWAVSGSASDSGFPLLAQSIFMPPTLPVPWYELGLHCIDLSPDCPYNVVGMSMAGIPAVLVGHNSDLAWGMNSTDFSTQKLYFWERDTQNPFYFRNGAHWDIFGMEQQSLVINDAEPKPITLYHSPQGVLISDLNSDLAVSLSWVDPHSGDFVEGILGVNAAKNWTDFNTALSQWAGAPMAFLYADQFGNLGEVYAGNSWESFPSPIYNPPDQMILPIQEAEQLENALKSSSQNVSTFGLLQADSQSTFPQLLLPTLAEMDFSDDETLAEHQSWLAEWDGVYTLDSPQAALFSLFWAQLVERVFDDQLGFETGGLMPEREAIQTLLNQPDSAWWDDLQTPEEIETRDITLRRAFESAIEQAQGHLGNVRERWLWSDLFYLSFDPPFLNELGVSDLVNRDALAIGGDLDSLMGTTWASTTESHFPTVQISNFRIIMDLADFSQSRSILATGQSGHPASPHYDDMIEIWGNGAYRDMLWDVSQVQDQQVSILRLRPRPIELE